MIPTDAYLAVCTNGRMCKGTIRGTDARKGTKRELKREWPSRCDRG
jgi:hypothetical protein